jgi:hypothetical protein
MSKSTKHSWNRRLGHVALITMLMTAAPLRAQESDGPQPFDTPEAASAALVQALEARDIDRLMRVLGLRYRDALLPADAVDAAEGLDDVVTAAKAGVKLKGEGDQRTIEMGTAGWTFPIELVGDANGWHFDTEDGLDEILARRIGSNELNAIEVMRAYGPAQMAYASKDRDGDAVLEYAQKLVSTTGRQDGLYWPDATNPDPSPFGPLVAEDQQYFESRQAGDPFHGYYFRILTRQEDSVPGGRYDYIINGNMIAGFAMIAVPADYGETGRTTFLVSHHGQILEKDLGDRTGILAAAIQSFTLDDSWDELAP